MFQSQHSISLLFNANKVYDRQIIEGIGHYLQSSKINWDVYLEEDFSTRLENIEQWAGDGIIADFDNVQIQAALENRDIPIVGVGGSYTNAADYPNVPYVATDNWAVVEAGYEHLKQKGLERFAFYGLPPSSNQRWAAERELAIRQLCTDDHFECCVYHGLPTHPETWQQAIKGLSEWLATLPNPIGIIAVTDARARHLMQACQYINKVIPDEISIVGIDDDEIARHLCRVSLSSVTQGGFEIGYQAAKLLHKRLDNITLKNSRILVPPAGVVERQSTDFKALKNADVIQAMHFIRHNACKGIKVTQVADYVGISRSNLEKRFKYETGNSIHTVIHNQKLEQACTMLQQTNRSTTEIANICGYPSLQYMYSVFRRHFDKTPKEYKEQWR